jgi:hypothetical protein
VIDPIVLEPLPVLELVNATVILMAVACIFGGFWWLGLEGRREDAPAA